MLAALEHELGVLEQRLRARREVESLRLDDHPAAARGLEELEAERAAARLGASTRSASIRAICFSFACACRDFVP